jgi:hypothetical protein
MVLGILSFCVICSLIWIVYELKNAQEVDEDENFIDFDDEEEYL